jgi:hypothetical protein
MLPADVVKCPVCGKHLGKNPGEDSSSKEIMSFSLYIIGIALIPLAIAMLIGLVCLITGK